MHRQRRAGPRQRRKSRLFHDADATGAFMPRLLLMVRLKIHIYIHISDFRTLSSSMEEGKKGGIQTVCSARNYAAKHKITLSHLHGRSRSTHTTVYANNSLHFKGRLCYFLDCHSQANFLLRYSSPRPRTHTQARVPV